MSDAEADAEADARVVDALQGGCLRGESRQRCFVAEKTARHAWVWSGWTSLSWREDEAFALCALSRSFAPLRPALAPEPELEKAPEWRAATR